jgi:WD40 repeat protein
VPLLLQYSGAYAPQFHYLLSASSQPIFCQAVFLTVAAGAVVVVIIFPRVVQVMSVAFSPDGGRAVTASKDGTMRIWNTAVRYHLQVRRLTAGKKMKCELFPGLLCGTRELGHPGNFIKGRQA